MAKGDIKNNENLEQCPKLRTHSPTNFLLQLKTNKIQIDKFKLSMSFVPAWLWEYVLSLYIMHCALRGSKYHI